MTELVLLSAIALVAAGSLLVWMANPWRSLLAWVCTLSVQIPYAIFFSDFRPAVADLFVPSMVLGLLLSTGKAGRVERKHSVLSGFVFAFAAAFLLVGNLVAYLQLGTIPQWTWLNKDIGLLDLVLCYFAFRHLVDSPEKLRTVVKVFVLSGSAINLLALAGGVARYVFGISNVMMREGSGLRLAGFNVNPNSYGGFILCVLLLQFALLLGQSKLLGIYRRVQFMNLALLGTACLMTLSRSALLGLMAGILVLFLAFPARASFRLAGVAAIILLATYAVVHEYTISPATSSQFWDVEWNSRTFTERMDTNTAALNMYLGSPARVLLGIGVGTFYAAGPEFLGNHLIIHNDFLWLLVEGGPITLVLVTVIFAASLRNCFVAARARGADSPIAIGVGCALIGTLAWTVGTEGLWHRHVWLLLALSEACYALSA